MLKLRGQAISSVSDAGQWHHEADDAVRKVSGLKWAFGEILCGWIWTEVWCFILDFVHQCAN